MKIAMQMMPVHSGNAASVSKPRDRVFHSECRDLWGPRAGWARASEPLRGYQGLNILSRWVLRSAAGHSGSFRLVGKPETHVVLLADALDDALRAI